MTNAYSINGYAILTARDTWPIRVPEYRGACRGLWWPLREHRGNEEVRTLNDALNYELLGYLDPSPPDAIVDLQLLQRYASAAEALGIPLYGVLCASPFRREDLPGWASALQTSCEHLGIDICYPTGSYSFLNDTFSASEEWLTFMRRNLNSNGLLSNAASADEFLRRYQDELEKGANWEELSDALPIELWHDPGLTALKRLWDA